MSQIEDLNKLETLLKKKSKVKPVAPIIKIVEQPDFSPAILKQGKETEQLAAQAIVAMRDSVNNNQAIMAEIVQKIAVRPKEFKVLRDATGDIVKIIPVYENG